MIEIQLQQSFSGKDAFYGQVVDNTLPKGSQIKASASGSWSYMHDVVADWLLHYVGPQS